MNEKISKRTLQHVFGEQGERKIVLVHGTTRLQDSRFQIVDIGVDHVAIKLIGDQETLVLPYASITSVKVERLSFTITYR